MFPSTYSFSGPYPYFPSSSSSSSYHPFTFLNPENASSNNTFPHDPLSAIPYMPTTHHHAPIPETLTNFAVADYAAMFKNDVSGAHYGSISNLLTNKKPASKKDRHSKIHTSQGLRDRRVRLSIEIARKFFDLQDMLGFDKASNTLEWLFNKSKKAMKELARSKNSSSSFSSSSECEEVISVINQDGTSEGVEVVEESKEMKLKRAKMKESRGKARARARERTSNKMYNTSGSVKVQDLKKKCPETENPQILHQLMRSSPFQPADQDSARTSPNKVIQPHHNPHLVGSELQRDNDFNVIEESIVIKRKLKQSLMSSSSHHQNLGIPREAGFCNSENHSSFPNLSPNWDANGATGRNSNFCAIASMNLSTGLQIFGKSWEECTNPRL